MISVIIPTHNRRDLLERKLESLEANSGDFEVIVVADNCSDSTAEFLKSYKPKFPFKFLLGAGKGAGIARNLGVANAVGSYYIFSDDDVILPPNFIEEFKKRTVFDEAVTLGLFRFEDGRLWRPARRFGKIGFQNVNGVALGISRRIFSDFGGFADWLEGYGGEDLELGYRIKKSNIPIWLLSSAVATHVGETPTLSPRKGNQAGLQAARIARHHRSLALALELGVWSPLLVIKMSTLPWLKTVLGKQAEYELAYAVGAWGARFDGIDVLEDIS